MSSLVRAGGGAAVGPAPAERAFGSTLVALALLTLALSVVQTAITPAIPVVQRDLGVGTTTIAWILSAYSLVAAVTTPIVGRLGDIFGRDRMLLVIVGSACAGCALIALTHSLPLLLVGRALQGAGGSIFALAFGVVRDEAPPARRALGFGVIGAMWGVGASAGYPLGGVIVDVLSYHWIFWSGLIGIGLSGAFARLVIPRSPLRTPAPVDAAGAALLAAGLASVLVAISEGIHWGWASARLLALAAGGVLVLVAWVRRELRVVAPMVDIRLLRLRGIWPVNASGFCTAFGMLIMFLLVPKLAQTSAASGYGFGDSVLRSSFYLLPMSLVMLLMSVVSGGLIRRLGARAFALVGAVATSLGFAQLSLFHARGGEVLAASAVIGIGIGSNFSGCANLISLAAPHEQIGEANGMSSTIRTSGGAIGAQIAAVILTSFRGVPWPADRGYTVAFAVAAGAGVAAFAFLWAVPRIDETSVAAVPVLESV